MRLFAVLSVAFVFGGVLGAAYAEPCDETGRDASGRHVQNIADVLAAGWAATTPEDANAAVAFGLLKNLHVDQLGFVDTSQVLIETTVIPEAETPQIFQLMAVSSLERLSDLAPLVRTPADLPRGDRREGLIARGFEASRDSGNIYVIGDPHVGGKGQAVIVNTGNFGMRVITYDGSMVSYADVGLYALDDSPYAEKRYEVTHRVDLVFPPNTPKPLRGF